MKVKILTLKERLLFGLNGILLLPFVLIGVVLPSREFLDIFLIPPDRFFYYRGTFLVMASCPIFLIFNLLALYGFVKGRIPAGKIKKAIDKIMVYLIIFALVAGLVATLAFHWYVIQKQNYISCHVGNPLWRSEYAKEEKYCTRHFKLRPQIKEFLDKIEG